MIERIKSLQKEIDEGIASYLRAKRLGNNEAAKTWLLYAKASEFLKAEALKEHKDSGGVAPEVCAAILRQSTPEAIAKIDANIADYFKRLEAMPDVLRCVKDTFDVFGADCKLKLVQGGNNSGARVGRDS